MVRSSLGSFLTGLNLKNHIRLYCKRSGLVNGLEPVLTVLFKDLPIVDFICISTLGGKPSRDFKFLIICCLLVRLSVYSNSYVKCFFFFFF